MSEFVQILDSIEVRVEKLFEVINNLKSNSENLKHELKNAKDLIEKQGQEIEQLKSENNSLKMATSLLGSDENKRDTKLKINSLIREIDYCIAQLSD